MTTDEQQQATADTPPTIVRDGGRAWVSVPLDSPYATRLRRFYAHWDLGSNRWWVGVAKATALEQLMALPLGAAVDEPEPEPQVAQQRSAAAVLVDMACEDYALGVTDAGEPYATHCDAPHLAMMLRGGKTGLRAELARRYWDSYQSAPPQQALADAALVLEGLSAQEDPHRVHLRVAEHDSSVYIDMGDADGHVIEISGGTWDIGVRAPVLFRRTRLTGVIPKPYADGKLSRLWEFVPIGESDRPLVLAWLVQAMIQSDVPHPVLALLAEHGSTKSSSTRCLVELVDPSPVPLRKAPRDADGWVTAANASWAVALDNLSGEIPMWLSDCLCRAVTGDGDVKRALYTDQDVSVIAFRRAVIINGVDIEVTQGDLADRLLRVDLPRVDVYRNEKDVAAAWADAYQSVLGGLLNLAANVHYKLHAVTVTDSPRMADFARVLQAVDESCGTDGLARYREQSKRAAADTLDGPFIAELVSRKYTCEDKPSTEILAALKPNVEGWKPPKGWPASARAVTGQLTRNAPALRSQGWAVDNDGGQNKNNRVQWTITPPSQPEKAGNADSPGSLTLQPQVSGNNSGESGGESGEPSELTSQAASYSDSPHSPENMLLTSGNESASQASQECGPSLAEEKSRSFTPREGDGRCDTCGHHIDTQAHADGCPQQREKEIA